MRTQRLLSPAFFLLGLLFCTYIRAQKIQKIYVNPKNPTVQKQSNFIDSVRFIPFEALKGVSFENSYASPTEKYYFVTDARGKVLYFYSKTGAFIKKVDFSSLGQNLYPIYRTGTNQIVFFGDNPDYTLTPKDRIQILLDWNNSRNLKYFRKYVIKLDDPDLTIRKSTPDKFDLTGAIPLYAGRYLQTKIGTSPLYPDSLGHEVSIYADGKLLKGYFPYNRISEPRFLFREESVAASISDTPYVAYITRPYCDTIYRLVKDSLSPAYQLVLPLENSLPSTYFSNPFKTKTEKENFERNNGWVMHQVRSFYETPRFLYFSIAFFQRYETFVYDKQAGVAYNVTKIKPDIKQYNQQLLTPYGFRWGNKFYQLLKADALVSFFKQNPGVAIPKELTVLLQNNPDKNSSVLIEYSFKN